MYTEKDIIITAQGVGWQQVSIKDELRIWGTVYTNGQHRYNLLIIINANEHELALHVISNQPQGKFLQTVNTLFPKPASVTIIVDGDDLNSAHHEAGDDLSDALEKMAAFLYDDIGISSQQLTACREAMAGLTSALPSAEVYNGLIFTLATQKED